MRKGLIPWSPLRDMDRFFGEDFFEIMDFSPAIDIYQEKGKLVVETPLAGVKPEDVEISVENDVLTISGKTEEKKEVKKEDYYRKELRQGSFSRSIVLPVSVKADKVTAESSNGMLKITIPKTVATKKRKIPVKVKK